VHFDLHDADSIVAAARQAPDATLLINNASTAAFATPLEADLGSVHEEFEVNFEGLYRTIRAFVPVLESGGGGQIVNLLSLLGGGVARKPVHLLSPPGREARRQGDDRDRVRHR
jgi:short-subunit dehydrogenase